MENYSVVSRRREDLFIYTHTHTRTHTHTQIEQMKNVWTISCKPFNGLTRSIALFIHQKGKKKKTHLSFSKIPLPSRNSITNFSSIPLPSTGNTDQNSAADLAIRCPLFKLILGSFCAGKSWPTTTLPQDNIPFIIERMVTYEACKQFSIISMVRK